MVFLITYDLHGPKRNYAAVSRFISQFPSVHPEGSLWFVDTNDTTTGWINALKQLGDDNDEFFVTRLTRDWKASKQDASATVWLNSPYRNW